MATTSVKLTGLTHEQLRAACRTLSRVRRDIPDWNNTGSVGPHWAPIVHCEGPFFTLFTPSVPATVALDVLAAVQAEHVTGMEVQR